MFCPVPSKDCKSLAYVARLHDYIWPTLYQYSGDFFDQAESAATKASMFFSRKDTKALFNKENINDLLSCRCRDCGQYQSDASAAFNLLDYEPGEIPSGSSGSSVTRFLVPEEYLHESFREMMENNYAKSVAIDRRGKKVEFG